MARGRMISKTLGTSSRRFARLRADYPDVGLFAQALYPLLVANADDWGRQKADAFTVKHSVWSTAPEEDTVFAQALEAMQGAGLILLYSVGGETYAQIVDFDAHQVGLQKRTNARRLPAPCGDDEIAESPANRASSKNFREVQEVSGNSPLTEQKGRELNLTEQNLTEQNRREPAPAPEPTARSKRPIFTGQRLTVFEWMLDDCRNTLGPHLDTFDIDEWFHTIDAQAVRDGVVIPKRDGGAWLQAALVAEAQRRGLNLKMASAAAIVKLGPRNCRHAPRCADDVACTQRATQERARAGGADVVPIAAGAR